MKDAAYRLLSNLSGVVGLWIVRLVAAVISAWYFVFLPTRLGHSLRMFRALFPDRGWWFALGCAWRQYQDFASVYSERLEVARDVEISMQSVGHEYFEQARERGTGAVVLQSHFGRWEIGARLLARKHSQLTVIMGAHVPDQGVGIDMRKDGVEVVAVQGGSESALDVLAAVGALREGGFVALSGDRAWGDARVMRLPFLGWEVNVPMAPFLLAMMSGAPLLVVFAYKVGKRKYRFVCEPPRIIKSPSRAERDNTLRQAALAYLDSLHKMLLDHPEQWQTFEPFLLDRQAAPLPSDDGKNHDPERQIVVP